MVRFGAKKEEFRGKKRGRKAISLFSLRCKFKHAWHTVHLPHPSLQH
jgi:hypothetical protein